MLNQQPEPPGPGGNAAAWCACMQLAVGKCLAPPWASHQGHRAWMALGLLRRLAKPVLQDKMRQVITMVWMGRSWNLVKRSNRDLPCELGS